MAIVRGGLAGILLILLSIPLWGQLFPCRWVAQEGTTTSDYVMDVSIGPDGVFAAGMTGVSGSGWNGWLSKYTLDGDFLWRIHYDEAQSDQAKRVSALPDGGCIVSGFVVLTDSDIWLERRAGDGARLWRHTLVKEGSRDAAFAQTYGGGDTFVLAGTDFVQHWSLAGTLLWSLSLPGMTFLGAAMTTAGAGIWVVGDQGDLVGLTAQGEIIWWQRLTDEGKEILWRDIALGPQETFFLGGLASDATGTSTALVWHYQPAAGIIWRAKWRGWGSAAVNRVRLSADEIILVGAYQAIFRLQTFLRILDMNGNLKGERIYTAEGNIYPFGADYQLGRTAVGGFFEQRTVLDTWELTAYGTKDGFLAVWPLPVKN